MKYNLQNIEHPQTPLSDVQLRTTSHPKLNPPPNMDEVLGEVNKDSIFKIYKSTNLLNYYY